MVDITHGLVEAAARAAGRTAADIAQLADSCNQTYGKASLLMQNAVIATRAMEAKAQQADSRSKRSFFGDQLESAMAKSTLANFQRADGAMRQASGCMNNVFCSNQRVTQLAQESARKNSEIAQMESAKKQQREGDVVSAVLVVVDSGHDAVVATMDMIASIRQLISLTSQVTNSEMDPVMMCARDLTSTLHFLEQMAKRTESSASDAKNAALKLDKETVQVSQYIDQKYIDQSHVEIKDSVLNRSNLGKGGPAPAHGGDDGDRVRESYRAVVARAVSADGTIGQREREMLDALSAAQGLDREATGQIEREVIDAFLKRNAGAGACSRCGSSTQPNWKVCPECGNRLGT